MDKRSFAFVFLLTAAFFFVNNYFFDRSDEIALQQENSKKEKYEHRVAKTSDLPLQQLFYDKAQKELFSSALVFDQVYLTNNLNGQDLPEIAYANGKKLSLTKAGSVAIYRSSESSEIPSIQLPKGEVELQLVSDLHKEASTTIGEYESNHLHFPYKTANNDAFALYWSGESYIPVGIWSYEDKTFSLFEDFPQLQGLLAERKHHHSAGRVSQESFYVLENDYQQVVFSNYGGAIAEINLAFKTPENKESVVLPIDFDRTIQENYSINAQFPLFPYSKAGSNEKIDPKIGGYTPLLRRDLLSASGQTKFDMPASEYAMNLVSEDYDREPSTYKVTKFTQDEIEFVGVEANRRVKKTFKLIKDAPYAIEMTIKVDGDSKGLWITSGVPEVEMISGTYAPLLQYYSSSGKKQKVENISLPKGTEDLPTAQNLWTSNSNGFFGLIVNPASGTNPSVKVRQIPGDSVPTRLTLIDAEYGAYPASNYPGYQVFTPYKGGSDSVTYRIYAGPYEDDILKIVDQTLTKTSDGVNPQFVLAITYQGWFSFVAEPFAKFLYIVMMFFHMITNSWGISIILLTLVMRILVYPLNSWSFKANNKLAAIGPKQKAIQEKFKGDEQRIRMETALLFKNEGVNPFSSCLPLFVQFPFLLGMLDLLKTTFELRGASFIPGWIDNLTAPDVLFSWKYPIIFFGSSFHLLPFILGGLMYVQTKMNTAMQKSKGPLTDQQKQMANMGLILTVVFTFAFYNMPSGLNIYWIFSTIFGMIQQWLMTSKMNVVDDKKPKKLSSK